MSNITNIFSSLNNFISLYSTADATISGAEAINSSQQLTNACENYEANPSTETAEAVRNAARDALLDKVELISELLPGDPFIEPSEQLTGSYASLIASRVDNSEMDEILEYQYKEEARNNDRARRGDIDTTCRDRFSDARTQPSFAAIRSFSTSTAMVSKPSASTPPPPFLSTTMAMA
jgi:hypothetical protein